MSVAQKVHTHPYIQSLSGLMASCWSECMVYLPAGRWYTPLDRPHTGYRQIRSL